MKCPECPHYPNCPGPDSDKCPNHEYVNDCCVNEEYTENHIEHGSQKYVAFDDGLAYEPGAFETNCQPRKRKKVVLELFFLKNKTQKQIIEITNLPQSTVSYYICAYRKKIEDYIGKLKN